MNYVSHARTPEELQAEVLSDLRRRLASLDGYAKVVAKSGAERARIARAQEELLDMLTFWTNLKIDRPRRKPSHAMPSQAEPRTQGISSGVTLPHMPISRASPP